MSTEITMAKAKLTLSTVASLAASAMLLRSISQDYFPHELDQYFSSKIRRFFHGFSNQLTIVIDEFDGLHNNQIYEAADIYLGSKISPSTKRLKVTKPEKEKNFTVTMESNEEVVDFFEGIKLKWVLVTRQVEAKSIYSPHENNYMIRSQSRSFELSFHKKYKEKVLNSYLAYVLKESKSMKQAKKTLKIFTVDPDNIYGDLSHAWTPVNLDHPARFETLAMESNMKKDILEDLERFVKRRDFYRKVGKAWKRGYLLYGPPGTGKSSLIAAMANYLNFDIYDLELSGLRCNSELRRLLLTTANQSILVVEDIDCTIEFQDRMAKSMAAQPQRFRQESQVTLSGLLNFIDGLWSSIGDERIIVFTTNHKEKLDPALLRPGRMDMHMHMSYCTPCGFRLLASNYLKLTDHLLFEEIEGAIKTTEVTPAELAEQLMRHEDPDVVLSDVITFLKQKKLEIEEAKAKELEEKEVDKDTGSGEKVGVENGDINGLVIQIE